MDTADYCALDAYLRGRIEDGENLRQSPIIAVYTGAIHPGRTGVTVLWDRQTDARSTPSGAPWAVVSRLTYCPLAEAEATGSKPYGFKPDDMLDEADREVYFKDLHDAYVAFIDDLEIHADGLKMPVLN
jgi:hypothetical protein